MAKEQFRRFHFVRRATFFLLLVSCFAEAIAIFGCIAALQAGFYGENLPEDELMKTGRSLVENVASTMESFILDGADGKPIEEYFAEGNYDVEIWRSNGIRPLWGTYKNAYETSMVADVDIKFGYYYDNIKLDGFYLPAKQAYYCRVYIKPSFPYDDEIAQAYRELSILYTLRYVCLGTAIGAGIAVTLCLFSLINVYRKQEEDYEIQKEEGHNIKVVQRDKKRIIFSIIAAAAIVIAIVLLTWRFLRVLESWRILWRIILKAGAVAMTVIVVVWFAFCIQRCRSVSYFLAARLSSFIAKTKEVIHKSNARLQRIPLLVSTLTVFLGICFLELLVCLFFMQKEGIVFWILEKLVLLPIVIYVTLCCKQFLKIGEALAQGSQEQRIKTSKMIGAMKRHGENLNSIGQGIAKAVDARMKSERMKTELITNVSHDLKTPLTSIINYSRLISEQKTENEAVTEYSQVLLRQSERLKKLLEDLVEASKATTGNLEVHLVPCEVGVLLAQAVGEYQNRLEEKNLELRSVQPEEPLQILADGRHLWRVFDNLLNNICKYAQDGSRVYLNVEELDDWIVIIFRNMSKYPLNISAEELEERFVRGDKSRHMEGNGLGLPIAKSLVELQNGRMDIVTDGDLFKVTIRFKRLEEAASANSL